EARYTPQGIQLTLDEALLFPSARAQLTGEGLAMLEQISRAIKPLNRHIRVVGHTDDRPIRSRRFASNWELSAARAVSVVAFFIQQGGIAPTRLSAAGYGASRPRAPNDTPGNRARNRRVEIILGQPLVMDVNVKHNEGHEPVRVR
ncbi:MAG: flagellar motor protein MotB, partial [Desulfatitalea sp.]|nr:flagellar motor protein MotB [Desulfatitalea sp.]